ncbi:VOC family protein [bacterium]|nr:VOC family protein [bacterium]
MKLGAFSISLSVQDLNVSRAFYQTLGFSVIGGSEEHRYLILKNEHSLIGLFQGHFEGHMLTFNPGWDASAAEVNPFDDVRAIHQKLTESGIAVAQAVLPESGPGHLVVHDPDGHVILIDQHR